MTFRGFQARKPRYYVKDPVIPEQNSPLPKHATTALPQALPTPTSQTIILSQSQVVSGKASKTPGLAATWGAVAAAQVCCLHPGEGELVLQPISQQ